MRIRFPVLALVIAVLGAGVAAAEPRDALVVSTSWLAGHLHDHDLVVLHVGDRAEYDAGHIPGARFVSLRDLSLPPENAGGLHLEMPPPDDLRTRLAALGISDTSRIVVYYGKDWLSPTTRVIFTLDYAGLGDRTSMLDGGKDAWVRDGHAVTTETPSQVTGTLGPLHVRSLIVDAAWVKQHLHSDGVAVVDARDPEFYDGSRAGGGGSQRAGHIPGAHSVPFSRTTDDAMMVRPQQALADIFTKAGIKPGDTVVAYCHIGQQATSAIFAARLLGHPVLLYDGSFEDWSAHADNPVTSGTQP